VKKTKYFNKEMYETEKKIKSVIITISIFIIGLISGLSIGYFENTKKDTYINMLQTELDSMNATINDLDREKSRLETIINNYTIESRRIGD
jgi:hypothetical protein